MSKIEETKTNKLTLSCERFDAEEWLNDHRDIWNHPSITDRNGKQSYEVADLMADFVNWYNKNKNQQPCPKLKNK